MPRRVAAVIKAEGWYTKYLFRGAGVGVAVGAGVGERASLYCTYRGLVLVHNVLPAYHCCILAALNRGRKYFRPRTVRTHVAEKYVRQVNFYRGSTMFVSAAALKPSMSLCCCAALKTHLTSRTYFSAT